MLPNVGYEQLLLIVCLFFVLSQTALVDLTVIILFNVDGSGRPATWDSFGIWDNRIEAPILLPPSIRYGTPIPQLSLSTVGCSSHIGQRRNNEDRLRVTELTSSALKKTIS